MKFIHRNRLTGRSVRWALIASGFAHWGCSSDGSNEAASATAGIVHVESDLAELSADEELLPPVPEEAREAREQEPRARKPIGASPQQVHLRWTSSTSEATDVLEASVENTTAQDVVVRPSLRMYSPKGDFRQQSLATMTVPAGQSLSLSVPVSELPVQSQGLSSATTLVLEWDQEQATGSAAFVVARNESSTVYTTTQPNGRTAIVRELPEQARFERDEAARGADGKLTALSVRDKKGGSGVRSESELTSGATLALGYSPMEVTP